MYTFLLWDTERYDSVMSVSNYDGNENLFISLNNATFPILSALTNCDEEFFTGSEMLLALKREFNTLKDQLTEMQSIDYINEIIKLIDKARYDNLSIVITPFITSSLND
ncbi:hypothetical protein AB7Y49_11280 [Providencia vermicola]|uniref:Uncharacterized protein n=1 Tax=Providencia vermicola TaxID=333965 RepID=A0AAX3S2G6_9GAMM|nr:MULTISPECIES: hypothetical protein [Providencia]ELX8379583.1 hypothetical protein [Providencia stuartii]EMD5258787.1 hypothetical protein [Providencia stuartii]MBG5918792.1 hypothetical protein [Providencia stuartii]MTB39907.1 hypothetical protein [Providencia sp. wls1949]MTC09065.1 hypothetical protein [Providencia sp. wls1948]